MSEDPSAASPRARDLGSVLAWGSLLALAVALTLQQILSIDYWWLLRTGQLIAETGAVPRADGFSYTAPGAAWIDIHWLFQLGLWGAFQLGGHTGTLMAKLGLMLALLALLAPIGHRPGRTFLSAGSLGLMLLAMTERSLVRPEVASWVMLAAVLRLLDRFERRGDRWVWAIVPLMLLWANFHGLFSVGLAVCGIYLLAEIARPLGDATASIRWPRAWTLLGVLSLAALATLANPNGLEGSLYPIQQLGMISDAETRGYFGRMIIELQPAYAMNAGPMLCFALLLLLSGASLAVNWRSVHIADVLAWCAFLYLAFGALRNVPLFAIVAAPMLVRNANSWLDTRPLSPGLAAGLAVGVSLALSLLAIDAARGQLYTRMSMERVPGVGVEWWRLPVAGADWLEEHGSPGPLAHQMSVGGFLIWRLYPEVPVMLDGRLEVFGAELFEKLEFDSPEAFERLDAEYHFGAVLQRHDGRGSGELLEHWTRHPEWRPVAVDDAAALFVRTTPGENEVASLDLDAPDLFPPPDLARPAVAELVLRQRTGFFSGVGRDDLALRTWQQARQLFPDLRDGPAVEALLRERLASPQSPGRRPRPGQSLSEQELIDFCREHIAHFKCPKAVEFLELPKTSTGKIQKFRLREKEWVGREKRIS